MGRARRNVGWRATWGSLLTTDSGISVACFTVTFTTVVVVTVTVIVIVDKANSFTVITKEGNTGCAKARTEVVNSIAAAAAAAAAAATGGSVSPPPETESVQ